MSTHLTMGEKIEDLIKEKKSTQAKEAQEMCVAASMLSDIINGNRKEIRSDTLIKLCKHFNISADWLLGLSSAQSIDENIKIATKTTGLSEKAIEILQTTNKEFSDNLKTISKMIESPLFSDLITSLRHYAMIGYTAHTSISKKISQYICEDQLRAMKLIEQQGDSISDIEVRFLALKSNLGLHDISALFLNEARDNIAAIAKEISESAK